MGIPNIIMCLICVYFKKKMMTYSLISGIYSFLLFYKNVTKQCYLKTNKRSFVNSVFKHSKNVTHILPKKKKKSLTKIVVFFGLIIFRV